MTWRKWMVRGLVFGVLGSLAAAALLYQAWTNPTATRHQVLSQLDRLFTGAHVNLESARLRLLGGISFSDLRMTRSDDLERAGFLYVPDGIIYHDKERLTNGDLAIRKIELHRMQLRVVRDHDGHWNLVGLLAPPNLHERVPMLVFKQATILVEDHSTSMTGPLLEIKEVNLTVINDPLETLKFEGTGLTDVAGPLRISGKMQRASCDVALELEATAIPIGPALLQRLTAVAPDLAAQVRNLHGQASLRTNLTHRPGNAQPLNYDATFTLSKGLFSHPRLAWPLQDIEGTAHIVNGEIPHVHVTANSGPTKFELTLKDLSLTRDYTPKDDGSILTDLVSEMELRAEHLAVNDELFKYLPDNLQSFKDDYQPSGFMSVLHTFRKEENGHWTKRCLLTAEDMQASYKEFAYAVEHIRGTVDVEYDNGIQPFVKLDLIGFSYDHPITLKGSAQAAKNNTLIEIDIEGEKIPFNQKLKKALPEPVRLLVDQFMPKDKSRGNGAASLPVGFGDFKVQLRRKRGQPELDKSFFITFHDAALRYEAFPYPLEHVTGVLEVHPDHWEAKNFHGTHKEGEISFSGRSHQMAGRASVTDRPDWVSVELHGRNLLLDDPDFLDALGSRPALQKTWTTLNLAGHMNFDAEVVDIPGQPQDIDVGVTINGCQMRPSFFNYAMDDVCGTCRYAKGRVYLNDVKAKHGASVLGLKKGQIILKQPENSGFQARFDAIQGTPIVPDEDFLNAVPEGIGDALRAIKLHSPVYAGTALVIDVGPEGTVPPQVQVWWDGGVFLRDATMQAGVELTGINGLVTCCGLKKGPHLELLGNVALDQATLLNQPVQDLHTRFFVQKDSPTVLRVRDLSAQFFGGDIGGEGRVEFGPTLKYDMTVKALKVQLQPFGRHNFGADTDMVGPVNAALHLMGEGRDIGGIKGHGNVFARDAKLYKLPPLLDLIKAFGLRLPDRTAFEQASATFSIDGPQVHVEQLDLVGNAISLRGQGTVDLYGTNVNLDVNADWARLGQFLPEAWTWGPRLVSDQLLKVKVRGRLGELRFEPEPLPGITEPTKRLFGNDK